MPDAEDEAEEEKGKFGDPKKLYKHNKELVKQNSNLTKQIETLKNEKESLLIDKNKLKGDLKSTEKELKKVNASLSSARSEVERLRAKSHKHGAATMGEGVGELQERVKQLEVELSKRNDKLANFQKRVGSRLDQLRGRDGYNEDDDVGEMDILQQQLHMEQEVHAKLERENSELHTRVMNLESDLNQLLQLMDSQQKEEFVLNTEQRSSRETSLRSADALSSTYAELKQNGHDFPSPFSSPQTSPALRHRNQATVDVATLQTCLKLAVEEKKMAEQQRNSLHTQLGSVQGELKEAKEAWRQEKDELLQQLQKACTETDTKETRKALERENLQLHKALEAAREKLQSQQGEPSQQQTGIEERSSIGSTANGTEQTAEEHTTAEDYKAQKPDPARAEHDKDQTKSVKKSEVKPEEKRPEEKRLEEKSEEKRPEEKGPEVKPEEMPEEKRPEVKKPEEKAARQTGRRGSLQKQHSKENFSAALAIFQNGAASAKPASKRERSTSETLAGSNSTHSLTSPAPTGSSSVPRKLSTENISQSVNVVGKPPIHPPSASGSGAHSKKHSTDENVQKSPSKMSARAKRMSWTVAQMRKSFEQQPDESSSLHTGQADTTSSSSMNRTLHSKEDESKEKMRALEEEKRRVEEEKAKKEKEEKRQRELEAEERRKEELEEKRRREAEEKERLRKEREERDRVRKEREERERERKRELEEKRKREAEEREKKQQDELEKKRQLEEKRRQEQQAQRELQRVKELQQRKAEREAALNGQKETEKQNKQEQEEKVRLEEEKREAEKAAQAAIDPLPSKVNQHQSPFGSIAMRRQAYEQKASPSSSPPVVLRRNAAKSPLQRPQSMDISALMSTSSPSSPSLNPTPHSSNVSSISVKTSKSPQTSPILNQRKEMREVAVGKSTSVTKPNPPLTTATNRQTTVSIVTTSSPPLRRAQTITSTNSIGGSLALSTPDLTSVGTSCGGTSREVHVGSRSPGAQRRTALSTAPKSPLSEKRMAKSVSFSPTVSTVSRPPGVSKPSPPVTSTGQPSSTDRMNFVAVPARLSVPRAADIKKTQSLQNIPEHSVTEETSPATTSITTRHSPAAASHVQRRPRSERPKTTSLTRADDLANLISKLQEKEKSPEKMVGNGVTPTPRTTLARPASMYGSITPTRCGHSQKWLVNAPQWSTNYLELTH